MLYIRMVYLVDDRLRPSEKSWYLYVELMRDIHRINILAPASESVVGDYNVDVMIFDDFLKSFMFSLEIDDGTRYRF